MDRPSPDWKEKVSKLNDEFADLWQFDEETQWLHTGKCWFVCDCGTFHEYMINYRDETDMTSITSFSKLPSCYRCQQKYPLPARY